MKKKGIPGRGYVFGRLSAREDWCPRIPKPPGGETGILLSRQSKRPQAVCLTEEGEVGSSFDWTNCSTLAQWVQSQKHRKSNTSKGFGLRRRQSYGKKKKGTGKDSRPTRGQGAPPAECKTYLTIGPSKTGECGVLLFGGPICGLTGVCQKLRKTCALIGCHNPHEKQSLSKSTKIEA